MNQYKGIIAALSGGILWGVSGVVGQFLFSDYTLDAEWLTAVRMILAGVILTGYCCISKRKELKGILSSKKDFLSLLIFSVFGLLLCQLTYLKTIYYSNAATATILQYLGPIVIMGANCIKHRRLPNRSEILCGFLAMGGTYLLATGGKPGNMSLTPSGLFWGLLSAVGMATYSILPCKLMERFGSIPVTGLGMLIGGLIMCIYTRIWQQPVSLDCFGWLSIGMVCLLGTILAYTVYLYGIKEIGAVKAGLLACSEPLSSAVLMMVWLGVSLTFADTIGFIMILATVFLSSKIK